MSGHGGSDGLHGDVPSLDYVVEDTVSLNISKQSCNYSFIQLLMKYIIIFKQDVLLGKIVLENPGVLCFLLGHSTGGAVVLKVCLVTISSFSQLYLGQV